MEQRNVLLEKLREETEIPEIVYQKAEQAFKQIHILTPETDLPAKKRTKRKPGFNRKKSAIVILAAVLMIGTLSVSAGTVLSPIVNWSNGHYTDDVFTEYQAAGVFSQFIEYEKVKELIFYVENDAGMTCEEVRVPIGSQYCLKTSAMP